MGHRKIKFVTQSFTGLIAVYRGNKSTDAIVYSGFLSDHAGSEWVNMYKRSLMIKRLKKASKSISQNRRRQNPVALFQVIKPRPAVPGIKKKCKQNQQ